MSKSKLILALDVDTFEEAKTWVEKLHDVVGVFKVGSQLFTSSGPEIIKYIRSKGTEVFLDLKFHDIPNTVAKAVSAAAQYDVAMLTLHACGGADMLQAAREAVEEADRPPLLLAVTVLTSFDNEDLAEVGVDHTVGGQVLNLARLAKRSGVDGVVASPLEVSLLREQLGNHLKIVVPGVRPMGAETNDQKRVMTPNEAITAGASYIVVGRPITQAPNPREAAERVLREIELAEK